MVVDDSRARDELRALGFRDEDARAVRDDERDLAVGRVARLDRGWSTVMTTRAGDPLRVRNVGVDVAVGDWVVVTADGERVARTLPRRSEFVRRASSGGVRAERHALAANIDVVLLVHAADAGANPRRAERELVLAFDSGASPVLVATKADLVPPADGASGALTRDPAGAVAALAAAGLACGVPCHVVSGRTGEGVAALRGLAEGGRTLAVLGASGAGKSTLVNALVGADLRETAGVRGADGRGRHTTVAAELVALPGGGWVVDTPGLRAVSLWTSRRGLERAFADVFAASERCRFRDCKHEDEPDCAVARAVADGTLAADRLAHLRTLVAEEAAVEAEREARRRRSDRKGVRRAARR
jgi:ribosome biogenesis GTPase